MRFHTDKYWLRIIFGGLLAVSPAFADIRACKHAADAHLPNAFAECRPLAEKGHVVAQFYLGVMYENGQGVAKDPREAARWYRMAALQGDAFAQSNLGVLYMDGRLPQDYGEALRWFSIAARQGYPFAQRNMGNMYRNGQGVSLNFAEAAKWYRLAADGGDNNAQYNLSVINYLGIGIPKNLAQAYVWSSISAASGNPDGARMRDQVAVLMKPNEIAEAKRLVAAWKPRVANRKK